MQADAAEHTDVREENAPRDHTPAAPVADHARDPVAAPEHGLYGETHSSTTDGATSEDVPPALILTEPAKADRTKPLKIFSVQMPPMVANALYATSDFSSRLRFKALHILPGFVVNHSSNTIGMTQLVGEALYFKSSGVNKFIKDEHRGTWKAFVYPPINVVEGVFKKSAFHVDFKQLLNPRYVGKEIKRFFDLTEAARVDLARDGKLSNRWSARSGFAGMTSMTFAAIFPDEKDDPIVTERMVQLKAHHPLSYVGYRVGKGLIFPLTAPVRIIQKVMSPSQDHHIGDGKREFAGIGMTITGFFSVLAGFRQPRALGTEMKYAPNVWQALGGAITTFAGGQLLLGIDNQQGWTNYGKTQFWRLLVLPMSIHERFPDKHGWGDPNAKYYFGAQTVFQIKNVVASLIGGAQKLPDGRVVDQKKFRTQAQEEVKAGQVEHKKNATNDNMPIEANDNDRSPAKTVMHGAQVEKAMPQRVVAQAEHTAS